MATMNISLPQAMKDWVEAQVATGRYANASDVMRDLVRREQDRAAALEDLMREVQKGIDSGPAEPFDFDDFKARMIRKYGDGGAA